MPIKVACQCGQKFAAKDSLAGKAVKCPKCGQALRIPAAQSSTLKTPQAPAPQPSADIPLAPPTTPSLADIGGGGGLFDDFDIGHKVTGNICPNCLEGIQPNAVLCVNCGFRLDEGEQLKTDKESEKLKRGEKKLESFGNTQLDRAARTLEYEKAESLKTDGAAPWWVFVVAIYIILSFAIVAMLSTPDNVFATAAVGTEEEKQEAARQAAALRAMVANCFLIFVSMTGGLMMLTAWIRTVIVAFKNEDSKLHGFLNLFFPIYPVYYTGMRTTQYRTIFELCVAALTIISLASSLGPAFLYALGGEGLRAVGQIVGAIFGVISYIIVMMAWARIVTYAYEEEESLMHAIVSCMPCGVGTIYAIVYGFMKPSASMSAASFRILYGFVIGSTPLVLGFAGLLAYWNSFSWNFITVVDFLIFGSTGIGVGVVLFGFGATVWYLQQASRE